METPEDCKIVYDRMIDLAAKAKERGIVVAFAFDQQDGSSDECYSAVVTNTDNVALLREMLAKLDNNAGECNSE